MGLSIPKTSRQHNKTLQYNHVKSQILGIGKQYTITSGNTKVNREVISHGRTVMFSWFLMVLHVRWSDSSV